MKITAAVAHSGYAPFHIQQLELDEPRADEVLVEMIGTGICHTDLATRDRRLPIPLPAVLGHEGAGVVAAVGENVRHLAPGDHVVLTYDSCGTCRPCVNTKPFYCASFVSRNLSGTRPDGTTPLRRHGEPVHGVYFGQSSFADKAIATARNTVKVPADIPLHLLGPLGCGIQTGAGTVFNVLRPEPGSAIAVFGAGSVGFAALLAAVLSGCSTIIMVGRNRHRLDLARELGATHSIDATQEDAVDAVSTLTGGGADFSIETTAAPAVLRQAVECLAVGGTCAHLGAAAPGTDARLDMHHLLFGRTLRGVIEGEAVPHLLIPALIDLHRQGRFPFDRLIAAYPLAKINEAVKDAAGRTAPKAVLTFD